MAQGAVTIGGAGGSNWVGDALNGGGTWSLRTKIPYVLGFMMLFDSWDSVVIAFTLPAIIAEWSLTTFEAGWLISSGYAGQFFGAILFGILSEKCGRLPVLRPLVIVMGVLAVVCAFAGSYTQLISVRFIQGIAIGGALPIAICYVNEIAPTATRGKFFGTFQFLMLSGFGLASLMSIWIVPQYGWRVMFGLGVIPLAVVPFLYLIPESPRWLAGRGRAKDAAGTLAKLGSETTSQPEGMADVSALDEAPRAMIAELFSPKLRRTFSITSAMWFLTYLVSFGLLNWVPTIYVTMFNIPLETALSYNSIVAVSVFVLPIVLRQSIDKIGRRPPAIFGTAVGGLALLAILFTPSSVGLGVIALVIIGQIGISVGSILLWPITAETYDTQVRAVALGASSSIARGASMLTPLVVAGVISATGSVSWVFVIFGVCSLAAAVLWWRGIRETAGREMGA